MSDAVDFRGDDAEVETRPSCEVELELDSVTLARLLDEVRNEGEVRPTSYNRMHNRHNRS